METCHFFSLHHTHSHTSKNEIHMNKHLILKPTYKISILCLSPVRKNYIRFCLCKSLVFPEIIHFSFPPEAHGPRGWGYFPRHSAFVIVRCYSSFCPFCLHVFNGKKEKKTFFVCFLEATGPDLYYKFCDRQLIVRLMFSISSFSKQVICEMFFSTALI